MNDVWLCPMPRPERPGEDKTIDAAYIRALQTWPLPWKERKSGPHRWALYAHVCGGYDERVEILRGADEGVRATVARKLSQVLAAERAAYPGAVAVMVTIGEETSEGFVFHVERQASPDNPRMWWPVEYRKRIEEREVEAEQEDMNAQHFTGDPDSDTFWDHWFKEMGERSTEPSGPGGANGAGDDLRGARLPWDPPER